MTPPRRNLWLERVGDLLHRGSLTFLPERLRERRRAEFRREAFSTIMRESRWGPEHLSGGGSTLEATRVTREIIERVVRDFGIRSLYDAACGDFIWMPLVLERMPQGFRYIGGDIVPDLIRRHQAAHPRHEFRVIDFVSDELPVCDLILCRDALQHLPVADIRSALENFSRSGSKYLLASTHLRRFGWRNGRDRRAGRCRDRNLLVSPFNLGDPLVIYAERGPGHKFLGLWSLPLERL